MRRIALLLEYDGARYGGSQIQPNATSIQAELEDAIRRLTSETARCAFAGRTDAGVHAQGQVAAFSTASRLEVETVARALNALLPDDIAVRDAVETDETFDPRRQATRRLYRYTIWNDRHRSPLHRATAWHVPGMLDSEAMAREAAVLLGEHDLASFGARVAAGRSTVRRVFRSEVRRCGPLVTFEIEATAFLQHQVRRTMGALVEVGAGRLPEGAFAAMLAAPSANRAGPAAPPHGLCLVRVMYGEGPLPQPLP